MKCSKKPLCPYVNRKAVPPPSDSALKSDGQRYCEGNPADCAVFQVMDKLGFLKLPKDLRPADTARASTLLHS